MIDASYRNQPTAEVRSQYVLPFINEILRKSGLIDHATALGIDVVRCDVASTLAGTDAPQTSMDTSRGVSTLFQEIATEYPSSKSVHQKEGGSVGNNEYGTTIGNATTRCYAELLEEASALSSYLTPHEIMIVATVASSCLLVFLIPQSHFQGFLRSYFIAPDETNPSAFNPTLLSLEERLVNATLSNQNHTSGGVFPYSASRMRSLVVDDDGFTSASFHRFLCQGLRPYLSCGMAFNFPPKDAVVSKNNDDDLDGISVDAILFQSGLDLMQLLAMAICPNPSNGNEFATAIPTSLSIEADKGAGGDSNDAKQLVNSTLPFSFQLSYSDRLQLVQLCTELVIPERENGNYDIGYNVGASLNNGASGDNRNGNENEAMLCVVLHQLQSALFGFASYNTHSEKDAAISYKALANIAMNEGKSSSIQVEFQRLLHATINSRSEYLTFALGDCLQELVTRYNGSRYYADGAFVRFSLGQLGECISDNIRISMTDHEKRDGGLIIGTTTYNVLMNKNTNKRQKTGRVLSATAKNRNPFHLIALLKVARPLFYFLLDSNAANKAEGEGGLVMEAAEYVAKSQLVKDITLLLCYPLNLSVVQSASNSLAVALAYHRKYLNERSNVKHLFKYTRQALNASGSVDIVQALRPLIITASRQSGTFATSLLSFAVKTCSDNKTMVWKIATLISSARPSVVSNRLAELEGCSQGSNIISRDVARDEIKTRLSCTMASFTCASPETIQHCLSLAGGITDYWSLYQLVRYSFATSNFGFAHRILNQRELLQNCSRQQSFLWLTILLKIAQAEEILEDNGAVGISDSLEALNSCHSTLQSLAAIVQIHQSQEDLSHTSTIELRKFSFQLDLLHARINFLNLCLTTRSLCSEFVVTGGNISARSNLFRHNIPKSFGMLASRYVRVYRLHGLHHCQQTRSILRIFIAMCQFMRDFVDALLSCESKLNANKREHEVVEDCHPKGDERYSMGSLLSCLRVGVLEKIRTEKSKDSTLLQAPELLNLLDTVLRCPLPFPPGFFRVESIPCACVNLLSDTGLLPKKQNDDHITVDRNGAEHIDVTPGLPFKLILSGVVPEEFILSADVEFNQIIAGKTLLYEGQLYEDDEAENTHSVSDHGGVNVPVFNDPFSTTMQPRGQFILPILCEPILLEGFYRIDVKLGCRDIRCTEWVIPTMKPLEIFLRVEEYSE